MKLSYNFAFVPDGTPIVCYNRASFLMDSIFTWFRKLKPQKRPRYAVN